MATRPLLSLHPHEKFVAVACGPSLRIYSSATDSGVEVANVLDDAKDSLLLVKFDPTGKFLVTSGTDKVVKFWDISTWTCLWSRQVPKRASTAAFTPDGAFVLLADKFGMVHAILADGSNAAGGGDEGDEASDSLPGTLFGHYCSVITDIAVSRGCKWVATSDRDNKIRISLLPQPAKMLDGAFEIQTFCLGHTDAVTGISLLPTLLDSDGDEELLASGSVDGTVRLWRSLDGELLDTFPLANALGRDDPPGGPANEAIAEGKSVASHASTDASLSTEGRGSASKRRPPAVMALTATSWHPRGPGGGDASTCVVAVSVEALPLVLLLAADTATRRLSALSSVRLPTTVPPACLEFDPQGQLWALMLAACPPLHCASAQSQGQEDDSRTGADKAVAAAGKGKGGCELFLHVLRQVPGNAAAPPGDADAMALVAEGESAVLRGARGVLCAGTLEGVAPITHLSEEIRKKEYPSEEVEGKKRKRADRKQKAAAAGVE